MAQVKTGDTVKVHYTGKLDNGEVFDSSAKREPLEFVIGEKKVIAGFEDEIIGMEIGQKKTITIQCEKAYGQPREELIVTVERTKLPADIKPEIGHMLKLQHENGQNIAATITGVTDTHITIDANHPLAGKDLTFEIELVEVK